MPGALLSYLAPSVGVFTCVSDGYDDQDQELIGQAIHQAGSQFTHLTFVTPDSAIDSPALSAVVEYLIKISGERGALHTLADVDEIDPAFEVLRNSSFATYSRQRVWQLEINDHSNDQRNWRVARNTDGNAIRALYRNLVPGMVQQVDPFNLDEPDGLVHYQGEELLAYAELKYGHRGIWVQPLVHPDTVDVAQKLENLVATMPYRRSRSVYFSVRTYQSWLENALAELGAEAGTSRALMVKHLAITQKAVLSYELPAIEGRQPEITTSIVNTPNQGEGN